MYYILESFKVQLYSWWAVTKFFMFWFLMLYCCNKACLSYTFLYNDVLLHSEILGREIVNRKVCIFFHFIQQKSLRYISVSKASKKNGGYLLSHKRSTIGVTRLNFSVRNGKRWNPCAIATWISLNNHDHWHRKKYICHIVYHISD